MVTDTSRVLTQSVRKRPRRQVMAGRRRRVSLFRVLQYVLLVVTVIVSAGPLLWIVLTAFKPDTEIMAFPPTLLPSRITFDNFVNLFDVSGFGQYFVNSLVVSLSATVVTVVLGMVAAYALTRFRFPVLKWIGELSLFAYMVPPILVLVPIARLVSSLGLANNLFTLTLLYTALLLPFALWTLRSYLQGVAMQLEEAAMIDGCTRFGAFRRVVIPQTIPGMIACAVFSFNVAWSEYLFAATLMSDPTKLTISPGLALLLDQTGTYSWGLLMAAGAVVVLPVLVLFVIAQRFLVGGASEGTGK